MRDFSLQGEALRDFSWQWKALRDFLLYREALHDLSRQWKALAWKPKKQTFWPIKSSGMSCGIFPVSLTNNFCTLQHSKPQDEFRNILRLTFLNLVARDLYYSWGAFLGRCCPWHSENVHLWAWMYFSWKNKLSKCLLLNTATRSMKLESVIHELVHARKTVNIGVVFLSF